MSATGTHDAVEVRNLTVRRGKREVLHDISLTIPRGSITGLLGPSGCGKTTLMRSIVGTQIVTAGQITALGAPAGSARLRRQIGYVTQAPSIYADISVHENVSVECRIDRFAARAVERGEIRGATSRPELFRRPGAEGPALPASLSVSPRFE